MTREKKSKGKKRASELSAAELSKSLFDLLERAGCADAVTAVAEVTWIFFLRILDAREARECDEANGRGQAFAPTLVPPYRWRDWAAPDSPLRQQKGAKILKFVNGTLLPAFKALKDHPDATVRQLMVSEIAGSMAKSAIEKEKHFLEVLDAVHEIEGQEDQHVFSLAPVSFSLAELYEEILLRLAAKASDGGQHYTPREIAKAMVRVLDPQPGRTIYDPACGTGGFLTEAYEHLRGKAGHAIAPEDLDFLRRQTFYGREKEAPTCFMAVTNLLTHGVEEARLLQGNTLSGEIGSDVLLPDAPLAYDYILSEPPASMREGKDVQARFEFQTPAAQILYIQHILGSLQKDGRAGLILESSTLSRVDSEAFVQAKRQWLDTCNVYAIVNLPAGALTSAGPSAKAHLVFFDKGGRTDRIWYYDLTDLKVSRKAPLSVAQFDELFRLLPERVEGERSWTEDFDARWRVAHEKSRPHREAAVASKELAKGLEIAWREAHSSMSTPEDLKEMETHWKSVLREAQESEAKALAIESEIYDLTSVHPNFRRVAEVAAAESRTAEDLLAVIEEQGRAVDDALARLKRLLAGD